MADPRLVDPGLWIESITDTDFPPDRPALFLDRDGTINIDTGYPSDPAAAILRPEIVPLVAAANRRGMPVVVVTNQSGIGRGYFGWPQFAALNERLCGLLRQEGAQIDMILACAYHEAGRGVLRVEGHPMRKPNPGMLLVAAQRLRADLARSIMVGDKPDDLEAGRRAGLSWLFLVGEGDAEGRAAAEIRAASESSP
jgi:D-glycero-D-manno-heptose 1,7-bisphosphate phosphatase